MGQRIESISIVSADADFASDCNGVSPSKAYSAKEQDGNQANSHYPSKCEELVGVMMDERQSLIEREPTNVCIELESEEDGK